MIKWIKRYPLVLIITVSVAFFLLTAAAGADTLYKRYKNDPVKEPLVSLVFQGMKDGISPLQVWEQFRQTGGGVSEAVAEAADGEDKETAGNSGILSGNGEQASASVSENDAQKENPEEPPVYSFQPVTEEYFEDALFIGDSRTVGLYKYAGMEEAAFYCKTSMTVWNILEKPIVQVEDERKQITVEQALMENQFGKIYLMVGINELGRGNADLFMEQYEKVVARIRQLQPDAILFVEGIMRVAGEKNSTDPIFNNTNINIRNERIAALADHHDIFYIDVNEAVSDQEGNLDSEYTFDQIHLKAAYYRIWKEFLLQHGIVR